VVDTSRLYGIASTFEAKRAVPPRDVVPELPEQRRKHMSKNSVVGKTIYEVEATTIVGFRTESGATYLVKNGKAGRVPTGVPLLDEATGKVRVPTDYEWLQLVSTIEEGHRVYMSDDKKYRITTPVEEIYYG
jgi:hypothetical protein